MLPLFARADGAGDALGKLERGAQRPCCAASSNRLCNLKSKPFFAIIRYDLPHLIHTGLRQPIRHRGSTSGVHPHVERAIPHEREAALGIIDLRRRHAQIQHHAIDLVDAELPQLFGHGGKAAMHHRHPGIRRRQRIGHRDRLGILVEHHQAGRRSQAAEQLAAVAAATEGAVDEDTPFRSRSRSRLVAGLRPCRALAAEIGQQQRVHRRLQQDGPMFEFHNSFRTKTDSTHPAYPWPGPQPRGSPG